MLTKIHPTQAVPALVKAMACTDKLNRLKETHKFLWVSAIS
jgi:hypothetical protein